MNRDAAATLKLGQARGIAMLVPGGGFRQLYNKKDAKIPPLLDGFVEVVLTY